MTNSSKTTKLSSKYIVFIAVCSALALVLRLVNFNHIARDYEVFLLPWFNKISSLPGAQGISTPVGNYGIPYQVMIWLFTKLPVDPLYSYKALSCVFDFVMAAGCFRLVYNTTRSQVRSCAAYAVALFLPTVIMNSSMWGQCDSIFTAFIIWSLAYFSEDRFRPAFIMLGFAFAFKLQAVFILPFYGYEWFMRLSAAGKFTCQHKKTGSSQKVTKATGFAPFSLLNILWLPAILYILSVPGFLCGRSLLDPITIYTEQSDTYHYMYMNFPSFWQLFGSYDLYDVYHAPALAVTFSVLAIGLFLCVHTILKKSPEKLILTDRHTLLTIAAWTTWTVVLFLPAMHERYGYLPDLLLCLLACCEPIMIPFAVIAVTGSLLHYCYYLYGFGYYADESFWFYVALFYFAGWLLFTIMIVIKNKMVAKKK